MQVEPINIYGQRFKKNRIKHKQAEGSFTRFNLLTIIQFT